MAAPSVELSEHEIDGILMTAVAKRDREALSALYDRYAESVYRSLAGCGASANVAGEVLAAAFEELWKTARQYQDRGRFRAHLFGIAQDLLAERIEPSRDAESGDQIATSKICPLRSEAWENTEALNAALAQLSTQNRRVAVLNIISRLSYGEIAESTGQSESSVRAIKAEDRKRLIAEGILRGS